MIRLKRDENEASAPATKPLKSNLKVKFFKQRTVIIASKTIATPALAALFLPTKSAAERIAKVETTLVNNIKDLAVDLVSLFFPQ